MGIRFCRSALVAGLLLSAIALHAETFATNSDVQVREGDIWSHAIVLGTEGRKTQVKYDDGTTDWVTADRLRKPVAGPDASAPAGAVGIEGAATKVSLDGVHQFTRATGSQVNITPTTKPSASVTAFKPRDDAMAFGRLEKIFPTAGTPWIISAVGRHEGDASQLALLDTSTGKPFEVRPVPVAANAVVGVADGGRVILSRSTYSVFDKKSPRLHLWQYEGDQYVLKKNFELVANGDTVDLRYALLATPTRAIVGVNNDMTFLLDLTTGHAVCSYKGGREPRLHSSGKIIECDDVIIRASDLSIMMEFKERAWGRISLDVTGTLVANVADRKLSVVKMPSGAPVATMQGAVFDGDSMHLLDASTILLGNLTPTVTDLKTAIPVWQYVLPKESKVLMASNGQALFAMTEGDFTSFVMATVPDPSAAGVLKTVKPDRFTLAPGAPIEVTGDLGSTYGAAADTAKKSAQQAIKNAGHQPIESSPHCKLEISSAAGQSQPQTYEIHMGPYGPNGTFHVNAPSTIVTTKLVLDGQTIWQQSRNFQAQVLLHLKQGQSVEDAVNEAGRPFAGELAGLPLPSYIVKGSTLDHLKALRSSTITADGLTNDAE